MTKTPTNSKAVALARRLLFWAVLVGFGVLVLGLLGSGGQEVYVKIEHRGQSDTGTADQ